MAKATKGNYKSRHAFPAFILSLLYTGASHCGKKQEFKNYLDLGFFHTGSYKLLKPFMQANNLTKAPWSEPARQGMTDIHHQQTLGQSWACHQAHWLPRTTSPAGVGSCWVFLQPTSHGFLHLGLTLTCTGAVRRIPELCKTRGSHFCCAGVTVGGPKATGWEWSDEKDLCMKKRTLSSHSSPRTIFQSLSPGFAPQMKAHFKPKLV